jgi:hypothetical protein
MAMTEPRLSPHVPRFARDIRTRGVMIGLPCYGGQMSTATYHGLREAEDLFRQHGLPWNVCTIANESLIQRARNGIAARFLASGCDRLVFIDVDIGFSGEQLLRLLAHDRPIVAGVYRKAVLDRPEFAVNFIPTPDRSVRQDRETGAIECAAAATGFMAIRRDVFEAMEACRPVGPVRDLWGRLHPVLRLAPEINRRAFQAITGHLPARPYRHLSGDGQPVDFAAHLRNWFDCWHDPADGGYLSEDYAFCARWRAMGGEVWIDPGLILDHMKTLALRADPVEALCIGRAA